LCNNNEVKVGFVQQGILVSRMHTCKTTHMHPILQ